MEKAFEYIIGAVGAELEKQNFAAGVGMEDPAGPAVIYTSAAVGYSVLYNEKSKCFLLRSSPLDDNGRPGAWKNLSQWIYDEDKGDGMEVAQSIAADFCDTVRGPQRMVQVQQLRQRKKKTEDENYIEPLFFYNRLCAVFPELKQEMNEDRIVYGQVRAVRFAREKVLPRLNELFAGKPSSDAAGKAATVLCDNYKNGDRDTRSIITAVLLTHMEDGAYTALLEKLEGDLLEVAPSARRLKGKRVKMEKVKKVKGLSAISAQENAVQR